MRASESIISDLLNEVEFLTYRIRNIKHCFISTSNKSLKERLIHEKNTIFLRLVEVLKIAELLNKKNSGKINFASLLIEKSKRTLVEAKTDRNLFIL